MGGLSGREAEFRRRCLQLPYWHNEALESRTAKLAFGVPYEILLGVLCHSDANVVKAAEFYLGLAKDNLRATGAYLSGFFARLADDCDLQSGDLSAKPQKRDTPMDFPRPSPARTLVWDFAGRLERDDGLHALLAQAPGARWFFREAPRSATGG
jgi:hypothetical protein